MMVHDTLRFLADVAIKNMEAQVDDVVRVLLTPARPVVNRDGCQWFQQISWPDRMPELKTWAGQVTLPGLIKKLQAPLRKAHFETVEDLLNFQAPLQGVSGFDYVAAADPLDVGFSTNALGIPVMQKVGQELLAVYAMECLVLTSWSHPDKRLCGFVADGTIYQMEVQPRAGGYYFRWGPLKTMNEELY